MQLRDLEGSKAEQMAFRPFPGWSLQQLLFIGINNVPYSLYQFFPNHPENLVGKALSLFPVFGWANTMARRSPYPSHTAQ